MRRRSVSWLVVGLVGLVGSSGAAWARSRPSPYGFEPDDPIAAETTTDTQTTIAQEPFESGRRLNDLPKTITYREKLHGHWRLAAGAGLRWGTFLVNNIDTGTNMQAHLDLGLRKRRWWIGAEYALMATTLPAEELATRAVDPMLAGDVDGLVHRLGGLVRYSISRLGSRDAGFDVYVEGGAGLQHLRWDDGGAWTRPDLSLGMGIGTWVLGETDHAGLTVGLRITLAPRNDVKGARPTCAGPCDQPTPPTGVDRSFLFDITVPFGK
jgi:hypothetical protein